MPPRIVRFVELTRAGEWWDYKIVPALAVLYATALRDGAGLGSILQNMALFLAALVVGAAFVGALNDLTDREDDRRAGKTDRIGSDSRLSLLIVALSVAAGCVLLLEFSDHPLLFWSYVAGWIAFGAYSIPPLRLKGRAAAGALCDAIGAHVVPALLAVAIIGSAKAFDPWLCAIAVWSFAFGLRGILGHQLADEGADRAARLDSFATRYGSNVTRKFLKYAAFPAELAALAAVLLLIDSPAVWLAFVASCVFLLAKMKRYRLDAVLTVSGPRQTIILADFYIVFLPLALLLALTLQNAENAILLPIHLLLFQGYVMIILRELSGILRSRITDSRA